MKSCNDSNHACSALNICPECQKEYNGKVRRLVLAARITVRARTAKSSIVTTGAALHLLEEQLADWEGEFE